MNILVVSPHPDDETLGAGGTILRMMDEKNEISWLNITQISPNRQYTHDMINKRADQLDRVSKFYHFKNIIHLGMETTKLDTYDTSKAVSEISYVFKEIKPEMLLLPDYNDVHSDHKMVFDWCYSCSKIFRYPYIKKILTMEIVSETDFGKPQNPFVPNYYVDITNYIDKKIHIVKMYDTELSEYPFPRSIKHIRNLAAVRGVEAGVKYAEAFRIIKMIY